MPEARGHGDDCPLCGSSTTDVVGHVSVEELSREYRRQLGVGLEPPPVDELALRGCLACHLKFFVPAVTGDAGFYAALQRFPWYYPEEKDEFAVAAGHIGPTDRVLEVGAGRGAFARGIACAGYVGLETSVDAVAAARAGGVTLRHETVEEHARDRAGAYDVVCAFQVLEHVPDTGRFLAACVDCLRGGGRLIVSVPNDDGFLSADRDNVLNFPPHHVTRWSADCLRSLPAILPLEL